MRLMGYLLMCLVCCISCKQDVAEQEPFTFSYDQRDQFVGTYRVEHDSGYVYNMQILKVDSPHRQYLYLLNFINLFDTLITDVYQQGVVYKPINAFYLSTQFGIKDRYGRRWDVGGGYDDTTTSEYESRLIGNKMVLYFRLQNMPWWGEDQVPYHFAYHKHIATKVK